MEDEEGEEKEEELDTPALREVVRHHSKTIERELFSSESHEEYEVKFTSQRLGVDVFSMVKERKQRQIMTKKGTTTISKDQIHMVSSTRLQSLLLEYQID
jgi:hypothetical protein